MPHYATNRGKLVIARGDWDDSASGDFLIGLLKGSAIPAAIDTQGEINPLNFVSELLALSGVTEADFTNYARTALSRTNASEDDTNNRVNMDAADVTYTNAGGTTDNTLYGGFVYKTGASDAARELVSVFLFSAVKNTNGSNLTLSIADLFRLS